MCDPKCDALGCCLCYCRMRVGTVKDGSTPAYTADKTNDVSGELKDYDERDLYPVIDIILAYEHRACVRHDLSLIKMPILLNTLIKNDLLTAVLPDLDDDEIVDTTMKLQNYYRSEHNKNLEKKAKEQAQAEEQKSVNQNCEEKV